MNINNWMHLFRPNSPSAQAGAEGCYEHYSRSTGAGSGNATSGKLALENYLPGFGPDGEIKAGTPDMTPVFISVVVIAIAYFIWKS
jgi:hypothetical protein